jgi:3-phenylpropionate/trans-cinnamate dioxygenase ferredoxin subunit
LVFVKLIEITSVPVNGLKYVIVGERELLVFNLENEFFCYDARCAHAGAPLFEGQIKGDVIVCPWHGARFSIVDGTSRGGPTAESLKAYSIMVKNNFLYVDIADI